MVKKNQEAHGSNSFTNKQRKVAVLINFLLCIKTTGSPSPSNFAGR